MLRKVISMRWKLILNHYPCHAQRATGSSLGVTLCVAPINKKCYLSSISDKNIWQINNTNTANRPN